MSQKLRRTSKSLEPVTYGWRPANSDDNAHAIRSAVDYWRKSIGHSARQDAIDRSARDPRIEFAEALVAAYGEFAASHPDYYFANTALRELGEKSDDRWKAICKLLAEHPLAETSRMAFPLATFVRYVGENRHKRAMWQIWIRVADPPPQCVSEMPTVLELPVRSSLHWRRQERTEGDDPLEHEANPSQTAAEPVTEQDKHVEAVGASDLPSGPFLGREEVSTPYSDPLADARRAAALLPARELFGLFAAKRHYHWFPIFLTQTVSVALMFTVIVYLPELIRAGAVTWFWHQVGKLGEVLNLTPILFK